MRTSKGIRSFKTTIIGIVMLLSALVYKFMPWIKPEVSYEPDTWTMWGFIGIGFAFIIYDDEERKSLFKRLENIVLGWLDKKRS